MKYYVFMYLKRFMIIYLNFQVAGTIITYELVLIQFHTEETSELACH